MPSLWNMPGDLILEAIDLRKRFGDLSASTGSAFG
jgi:hypothetical protein